jgi:hypothetical protein
VAIARRRQATKSGLTGYGRHALAIGRGEREPSRSEPGRRELTDDATLGH